MDQITIEEIPIEVIRMIPNCYRDWQIFRAVSKYLYMIGDYYEYRRYTFREGDKLIGYCDFVQRLCELSQLHNPRDRLQLTMFDAVGEICIQTIYIINLGCGALTDSIEIHFYSKKIFYLVINGISNYNPKPNIWLNGFPIEMFVQNNADLYNCMIDEDCLDFISYIMPELRRLITPL
jgi:hypothetical protein